MSIGNPGASFPFGAWRSGGRSGQQMSAAPHAPPRTFLRLPRLLTRRPPPALANGLTWSVSLGRVELSELLPHPSGAVTPDVALRCAALCSLLSSAPPGGSRRRGGRCDATFVRSSGACVARRVGSLDSPVNTRQSAFYSKIQGKNK